MLRRFSMALLVLVVGGFWMAGVRADESKPPKKERPPEEDIYELHKLFIDTLDEVQEYYVEPVTREELVEAAIRGVLSELDPYSNYISPRDMDRFRRSVESQFGGIGIEVTLDRGQLRVLSPLAGTPAYRAGLMAGDRIVEIDGESTAKLNSLDGAVRKLTGEKGTKVTLTVIHPGQMEKQEITVTRDVIRIDTVLGDRRKPDGGWDFFLDEKKQIGYVRVTAFSRNTAGELQRALSQLKQQGLRGLILDVRFNPGGLLTSAIEVSDLFISKGRIVSTKGRQSPERTWDARRKGTFEGFPMVVLINRFSASASEIVSACLQDHKRAVIMGERTWGKGSVQNVIEMEDHHSAIKLTTAGFVRPNGKNINRSTAEDDQWGVTPDEAYELTLTDRERYALFRDRQRRDSQLPNEPPEPETVPSPDQPAEEQAADEAPQPEAAPPEQEERAETAKDQPPTKPEDAAFVDRQLQMAVDYLTDELARAD